MNIPCYFCKAPCHEQDYEYVDSGTNADNYDCPKCLITLNVERRVETYNWGKIKITINDVQYNCFWLFHLKIFYVRAFLLQQRPTPSIKVEWKDNNINPQNVIDKVKLLLTFNN